ncbi:MAG: ATP-binding protein, partial [Thermomicrobiales bacterium]
AELERLLGTVRLVTLTGAGGIGKTRLAQEAARACSAQFPDGVAFIDLAPLGDSALVLPTIARAIGVDETGGRPTSEHLAATIGERRLLLVLDSSEHLAAAGPDVAGLLEACPHLTVLTTSRIRPRLRGEQEYPVVPLALPDSQATVPAALLAELSQVAAVDLFARRAMAARPNFSLSDLNIGPVVAICRRLDGLPLAIELAAPQVRVLSPTQLLHRLQRPLDVLGTTTQDIPARQRTLRATIAWSYDLLSPREQVLFRRLSVFAGGWSLEATEEIASIDGDTTAIDAVDTLAALIDQNLVQTRHVPDGDALRYSMLETIREFAAEQLTDSGEGPAVRDSHVDWMARLAADASRGFFGPDEILWLDRIEREHDNVRAALAWLTSSGDNARALPMTSAIWWFWGTRGYGREALDWIEKVVSGGAEPADGDADRIETLTGATWIAALHGEADRAANYAEQAVALARVGADDAALARALFMLSLARGGQGDHVAAVRHADEALTLFQRVGDRTWVPFALNRLGVERSEQEDYAGAAALYETALTGWRDVGQPWGIGTALLNLGLVARQLGDNERAASLLRECVPLAVAQGDRWGLVELLIGLADIAADAGEPGLGARLLGAANRIHTELGIVLQSYVAQIQTRALEAARSTLGQDAFADEWAKGRALSLDEAIAAAMQPGTFQPELATGDERIEPEDPRPRGSTHNSPGMSNDRAAQDPK